MECKKSKFFKNYFSFLGGSVRTNCSSTPLNALTGTGCNPSCLRSGLILDLFGLSLFVLVCIIVLRIDNKSFKLVIPRVSEMCKVLFVKNILVENNSVNDHLDFIIRECRIVAYVDNRWDINRIGFSRPNRSTNSIHSDFHISDVLSRQNVFNIINSVLPNVIGGGFANIFIINSNSINRRSTFGWRHVIYNEICSCLSFKRSTANRIPQMLGTIIRGINVNLMLQLILSNIIKQTSDNNCDGSENKLNNFIVAFNTPTLSKPPIFNFSHIFIWLCYAGATLCFFFGLIYFAAFFSTDTEKSFLLILLISIVCFWLGFKLLNIGYNLSNSDNSTVLRNDSASHQTAGGL
jgi:hypothetical protein